jgi:hypothetical protein
MAKRKPKLDTPPATKKPPFVMPEPNDDASAFGWELRKLRHPSADSKKDDIWPGRHVFQIEGTLDDKQTYGHEITFIDPAYLQMQFDHSPEIRAAAEKVRAASYSPEAIKQFRKTILRVFRDQVLPTIDAQFAKIAGMVAEFYAARLAHIDTFGFDDEEFYEDQIEPKTTKSRR